MTVSIRFLLLPLPSCYCYFLRNFYPYGTHVGFTKFYETYTYECFRSHLKPRIISLFPVMCHEPLRSDSVPLVSISV
jgi:hypothetical protein